jgi:hypothetical protein
MQPIASTRPSLIRSSRDLRNGAMWTTRRRASASVEARLGNPSLTYFHMKQVTRSRRVPHVIFILPSILCATNNRILHGFEAQNRKPSRCF